MNKSDNKTKFESQAKRHNETSRDSGIGAEIISPQQSQTVSPYSKLATKDKKNENTPASNAINIQTMSNQNIPTTPTDDNPVLEVVKADVRRRIKMSQSIDIPSRSHSAGFFGSSYLSSSLIASSAPEDSPPLFWHQIFEKQRRCSVDIVSTAIHEANQKHAVFTPPRVDSSLIFNFDPDLITEKLKERPKSSYQLNSFIHNLNYVEKEVGMGLRMVSDIVNLNQTGLGHDYQLNEHPSLMYNRAYSRSFPGAPMVPRVEGDEDNLFGCHGFKRKKERMSIRGRGG